jgi:hypothetical protein
MGGGWRKIALRGVVRVQGSTKLSPVDHIETCLDRVLHWSSHTNGPREKGAAPVTRIFPWVSNQCTFFFSSTQPFEFSPVSGGRVLMGTIDTGTDR